MAKKVSIEAGHGGFGVTPGKRTPDGEYEWNFNDKVVDAAVAKLKANGVDVLRVDDPSGKTDVPLKTRTDRANAWGADIHVSVHHNANTGKWGTWTGTETFTYTGSQPKSEKLAKEVQSRLVKAYGLKDRGVKKENFHIVRETKMPAILTEGGYMDSSIDIKKLRDNGVLKKAGEAIADGVLAYFGMSSSKSASSSTASKATSTSTKTASSTSSSKYPAAKSGEGIVDYLKRIKVDSSMTNRKKLADQYGIKNYSGTASQNTQLLDKLAGSKKTSGSSSKSSWPAAKSGEGIVDYLKRIKQDSSFANRKNLAAENGISNYTGTASQNTKLLEKISG